MGTRAYVCTTDQAAGGYPVGSLLHARIYRHGRGWAFKTVGGFLWARQWGYRSRLAATRAAARWFGKGWRSVRAERTGQTLRSTSAEGR